MNRAVIIAALSAYRIIRGSGVSEPLRAVDVQGIADAVLEAAPVEASGSERDQVEHLAKTLDKSPDEIRRALANLEAKGLIALRPQPSGETREAVARLVDPSAWRRKDEGHPGGENFVKKSLRLADRILALIHPAPVASGGQHSSGEGERYRLVEGPSFSETLAASLALRKPYVLDLSGLPPEKRQSVATVGAELNAALELGADVLDRFSGAAGANASMREAVERLKADADYFDHPEEGAETHCRALCWVAKDIRTVLGIAPPK